MTSVYDDINSDLVQALEGVDVLTRTDIGRLKVDELMETARLIAILDRRVKRMCAFKLDEVKTMAEMHASLEWGQSLMGKDTSDVKTKHKSLLQRYTIPVKT
jgi:hypothetical protein